MPQSIYDNGGMIGATLDFGDTEQYVISTTTQRATPVFVGYKSDAEAGGTATYQFSLTTLTGGIASAPAEGDIVIVASAVGAVADINLQMSTAGYTELVDLYSNDTSDANLAVYYKVMGSVPDTSVTIVESGSTSYASAAVVHVWRDIDPTNPIDVTSTTATGTNGSNANPPAITTATENAVVLAVGAGVEDGDNGATVFTSTGLSNFISVGSNDTYSITVAMGSITTTTPTTVDPAAFTSSRSSTSESWAAATVALRPKLLTNYVYGNFKNSGIWSIGSVLDSQPVLDREASLTLTRTHTASGTIAQDYGTQNTVFAATLVFPTSPTDGLIFETGGSGDSGTWLGIKSSGTKLVLRAGDSTVAVSSSTNSASYLEITNFPKDGQAHVMVWDYNISTATVRLYIDGRLAGSASATDGSWGLPEFSGNGDGAYLSNSSSNVPTGETTTKSNFTEAGPGLRVYENQLVVVQ